MNNLKLKHILFASALMASMSATAQETYLDTKFAENSLTGTARYGGMGGAMEALGADISTMSSNPAGILAVFLVQILGVGSLGRCPLGL